jgi:hypothetical protein
MFRTEYFTPEKGSILHSGIYNRELTSVLASIAVAGTVYIALFMSLGISMASYILSAIGFILSFPFFRRFVFKGTHLETIFNSSTGKTEIYLTGITRKKKDYFSLDSITDISVDSKRTSIENPDGVAFVEKISLQHGMAIPDFAEETIFYMLKLHLADGTDRIIYSDSNKQDVISAQNEVKEFMGIE